MQRLGQQLLNCIRARVINLFGTIRVCQEARLYEALLTCQIKLEI